MGIPKFLIVDKPVDLERLYSIADNPNYPTIDVDAVLSQILDVVSVSNYESDLLWLADEMGFGEAISARNEMSEEQSLNVINLVYSIGKSFANEISSLNGYSLACEQFPYRYEKNHPSFLVLSHVENTK